MASIEISHSEHVQLELPGGVTQLKPSRLHYSPVARAFERIHPGGKDFGSDIADVYRGWFDGMRAFFPARNVNGEPGFFDTYWSQIAEVVRAMREHRTDAYVHLGAVGGRTVVGIGIVRVGGHSFVIKELAQTFGVQNYEYVTRHIDPQTQLLAHLQNDQYLRALSKGQKHTMRGTKVYALLLPSRGDTYYWIEEALQGTPVSEYFRVDETRRTSIGQIATWLYERTKYAIDPTLCHGYTNSSEVFVQVDQQGGVHAVATDLADSVAR